MDVSGIPAEVASASRFFEMLKHQYPLVLLHPVPIAIMPQIFCMTPWIYLLPQEVSRNCSNGYKSVNVVPFSDLCDASPLFLLKLFFWVVSRG